MIGTRGVPARYGGFETAVEEIGARLVQRGHQVTVYCRNDGQKLTSYKGMDLVNLPALKHKVLETLSHTVLSVLYEFGRPGDAAIVFNAANACLVPILKLRGIPVAIHVDGLESHRKKWGRFGRRYYLISERLSVALAGLLIADAVAIQDYYRDRYGAATVMLPYGMPNDGPVSLARLSELALEPNSYHLVVARMEPENHILEAVQARQLAESKWPLVVVGDAPYADEYRSKVRSAGASNVVFTGAIYDQELLNALYAGAATYWHGHSVGGTNPSLLRALANGTPILAHDNCFNREVSGEASVYWRTPEDLARALSRVERELPEARDRSQAHAREVASLYDWDTVTAGYEEALLALANGG